MKNFTWGTKGFVVIIAKEKSEVNREFYINLMRPGSGTADGEVTLDTKFPSGYLSGTKWDTAKGFSNNKKVKLHHVRH